MIVGIHQPHYFPWVGYFDKIAKSSAFVLLDQVQFEKGSMMNRNRVIDNNGEIKYLTVSIDTNNHLNREFKELKTKDNQAWIMKQKCLLANYYRKAPAYKEIMDLLDSFFEMECQTVCQWTCESIILITNLLEIRTPLVYQSEINYNRDCKKSNLVLAICKSINATTYLSGKGASVDYLDREQFAENNVRIVFQNFAHPLYHQINSKEFIPGVSILDMLFNCGVEKTKEVFWKTIEEEREIV